MQKYHQKQMGMAVALAYMERLDPISQFPFNIKG